MGFKRIIVLLSPRKASSWIDRKNYTFLLILMKHLAFSLLKAFGHPMPLVSEASSYWRCPSSLQWVRREGYYFLWDQKECYWNGNESAHKAGKPFFILSLIEIIGMKHSTKNHIILCGPDLIVIFRIGSNSERSCSHLLISQDGILSIFIRFFYDFTNMILKMQKLKESEFLWVRVGNISELYYKTNHKYLLNEWIRILNPYVFFCFNFSLWKI